MHVVFYTVCWLLTAVKSRSWSKGCYSWLRHAAVSNMPSFLLTFFSLKYFFAKVYLHRRSAWCNSKVSWMFYIGCTYFMDPDFFLLKCLLSKIVMFGPLGAQVWEQNIAKTLIKIFFKLHLITIIIQQPSQSEMYLPKPKRSTLFIHSIDLLPNFDISID